MSASRVHALLHRASRAISSARLRGVTTLGARAKTIGAPQIKNRGRIDIGDDFVFSAEPVASHIVVSRRGVVTIGNGVTIESGAAIACDASVSIGDRVRIGRNVMILDTDFHDARSMRSRGAAVPIVIGDGARIGDGAILLKGARIGKNARVGESSVVSSAIADGAFASGVPARVQRGKRDGEIAERVHLVVAETLDVENTHAATWDSLSALRLLIALEEEFDMKLAEDALRDVANADAVVALVERSL